MAKVTIERLYTSSSKQDEITFLKKVREAAGEDTYMADFLSDGLLSWLERRITDDWSTDIMEEYTNMTQNGDKNATELVHLQHEYKALVDRAEKLKTYCDASDKTNTSLEGMVKMAEESAANFQKQLVADRDTIKQLRDTVTMMEDALKMHTSEKRALLESIQTIVFDEDGAEHERVMLRMLLTTRTP